MALLTCVIVGLVAAGIKVEVADARGAGGLEVDDVQEGVAGDGLPGAVAVAHAEEGARRVELYFPDILKLKFERARPSDARHARATENKETDCVVIGWSTRRHAHFSTVIGSRT